MPHGPRAELTALTSLRGIAAILVMFHHFMFVLLPDVGAADPTQFFLKSYLWVDLFFILSGFVLAYVYQSIFRAAVTWPEYRIFMQTRFARIYPLHVFILLLFVAFESLQWILAALNAPGMEHLPPPFSGEEDSETLLANLLLLQTLYWKAYWNQPAWSISAEWLIYFVLPFLIHWLLPIAHRRPAALATIALVPLMIIEWHFGDLGLRYAGWPMLIRCLCEATLGLLAFRCVQVGLFSQVAAADQLTRVLTLNLILLALPVPGVISVAGFAWLVLCAARLPSNQPHFLNQPWLLYLGKISYSIYLVHWLVMDVVRDSVRFSTGTSIVDMFSLQTQIVVILVMVVVVIGVSDRTYAVIESPMRKQLKPVATSDGRT